jgi:hypothetical protein
MERDMRQRRPRAFALAIDRGAPGSRIVTAIVGRRLEMVTAVRFLGSGLAATILRRPDPTAIAVAVSIAPDAMPGSRPILLLTSSGEIQPIQPLFYVMRLSSPMGISGIGSHLL